MLRFGDACSCVICQFCKNSFSASSKLCTKHLNASLYGRSDDMTPANCLHGCNNLTSVKLSGNHYSSVPTFLSSVTTLKCLHMANNDISSGLTACLTHLTGLTKLVMQQCQLHTIPDSFAALSNLQWLCLSRNRLSSLPDRLPWRKLTLLHLRGNELGSVPCSALSGATHLQSVDCGDNFPLQVSQKLRIAPCTQDAVCYWHIKACLQHCRYALCENL